MAVFVVEFPGFLVPMVAWGIKIVCKKFEEILTKIGKINLYHIFAQLQAHIHFIFVCKTDVRIMEP